MPAQDLTRGNTTRALRIMLPAYPVFCYWIGISYMLSPPSRTRDSVALNYLDQTMDLSYLGLVFLFVGSVQVLSLGLGRRWSYQSALAVLFGLEAAIGAIYVGAIYAAHAPYSAAAYPLFVAVACWASIMSINSRESQS